MSAFVCGPDHFKALAIFAASRGNYGLNVEPRYVKGCERMQGYTGNALAEAYANLLFAENIRSVMARYPDTQKSGDLPGPCDMPEEITITNRDMCNPRLMRLQPVWLLKMCDCLEYQSCETDDWQTTPACDLLRAIRKAAIRALPGYDAGPWDYYADETKAA